MNISGSFPEIPPSPFPSPRDVEDAARYYENPEIPDNEFLPASNDSAQKIKKAALRVIGKINNGWKRYGSRVKKLSDICLKCIALTSDGATLSKIDKCIAGLGLISAVDIGLTIPNLVNKLKDLIKECKMADASSAAWTIADIVHKLGSVVKTIVTFLKSLGEILKNSLQTAMKALSHPICKSFPITPLQILSLVLLIYESVSTLYKLIKSSMEYHELKKNFHGERGHREFKEYLKQKVGVSLSERVKIIEGVYKKHGLLLNVSKADHSIAFTVLKLDNLTGKLFKHTPELQATINQEVAEKIKVLKSKKINRLKRVDKKITDYMQKTLVHLRLHHFTRFLYSGDPNEKLESLWNFVQGKAEEGKVSQQEINTLFDTINFLGNAALAPDAKAPDFVVNDWQKTAEAFASISSKIDEVLDEYIIDSEAKETLLAAGESSQSLSEGFLQTSSVFYSEDSHYFPVNPAEITGIAPAELPAACDPADSGEPPAKYLEVPQELATFKDEQAFAKAAFRDLNKLSIRRLLLHSLKVFIVILDWIKEILGFVLTPLAKPIFNICFSLFKLVVSVLTEVYQIKWMSRGLENARLF